MADQFSDGIAESLEACSPELAAGVMDELRKGLKAETVLALAQQEKIAEATDRIEFAAIDGIGECTMRLDPTLYHYWGKRLGYQCWQDKAFKKEIHRDNESVRVRRRRHSSTFAMPGNSTFLPRQSNSHPAPFRATAPAKARTTPNPKPAAGVAPTSAPLPVAAAGPVTLS